MPLGVILCNSRRLGNRTGSANRRNSCQRTDNPRDLLSQLTEILDNLAAIVDNECAAARVRQHLIDAGATWRQQLDQWLGGYIELRGPYVI